MRRETSTCGLIECLMNLVEVTEYHAETIKTQGVKAELSMPQTDRFFNLVTCCTVWLVTEVLLYS